MTREGDEAIIRESREQWFREMDYLITTVEEMFALIEGGEEREDFEEAMPSFHFTEIEEFLRNRLERMRSHVETTKTTAKIFKKVFPGLGGDKT